MRDSPDKRLRGMPWNSMKASDITKTLQYRGGYPGPRREFHLGFYCGDCLGTRCSFPTLHHCEDCPRTRCMSLTTPKKRKSHIWYNNIEDFRGNRWESTRHYQKQPKTLKWCEDFSGIRRGSPRDGLPWDSRELPTVPKQYIYKSGTIVLRIDLGPDVTPRHYQKLLKTKLIVSFALGLDERTRYYQNSRKDPALWGFSWDSFTRVRLYCT